MQYAIEISSNCNCQASQGRIEIYSRWGGESLYVYKISSGIWQWKNFV